MQVCHRWMPIRAVTTSMHLEGRSRWSILLTSEKLNEAAREITPTCIFTDEINPLSLEPLIG